MSRIRKSKKIKNKNIKSTIVGLSIMLGISITGAVGSYAYFTDKETVKNDLVITMGNLITNIDKSLDINLNKENTNQTKDFSIKNNGSLQQNLQIGFVSKKVSPNLNLNNLNCNINMSYKNQSVRIKGANISNVNDLINIKSNAIVYTNSNELVTLSPGEKIECSVKIGIKDELTNEQKKALEDKSIDFDTNVEAIQIKNKGGE